MYYTLRISSVFGCKLLLQCSLTGQGCDFLKNREKYNKDNIVKIVCETKRIGFVVMNYAFILLIKSCRRVGRRVRKRRFLCTIMKSYFTSTQFANFERLFYRYRLYLYHTMLYACKDNLFDLLKLNRALWSKRSCGCN